MLNLRLISLAALAFTQATLAHFSVEYPEWRGDSFEDPYNQWEYPCAGFNNSDNANRTEWPISGGSVAVDLHHDWTYMFVNIGLGSNAQRYNVSLTPMPLNVTGNGTLCFPRMQLPAGIEVVDGQNATIQVVTVGESGSALYNCADITFRTNATILTGDACQNTTLSVGTLATEANAQTSNATNATTAGAGNSASVSSVDMRTMFLALVMFCLAVNI